MFYILEKGPRWSPDLDLSGVDWVDQSELKCILPAELHLLEGPDPHALTFLVKADPAYISSGAIFNPIASVEATERSPRGMDETMALPAAQAEGSGQDVFLPFQLVRLVSYADATRVGGGTVRFVGLILNASLSLETEEWQVKAYEIARWYMTRIVHKGILYQPPVEEEDPTWLSLALPVYNEGGKADQLVEVGDGGEVNTPYFTNSDLLSYDGVPIPEWGGSYAGYWTLGSILNQLREIYYVNPAIYGVQDLSKIMTWEEAEAQWPFLFELDGVNQVVKDFALGGLTLNECIDAIVKRAGRYTWTTVLDPATGKYDLRIYHMDTGDEEQSAPYVALTRGSLGGKASDEPDVHSGVINYDWSDSATEAFAFGRKERWEASFGWGEADEDDPPMAQYILEPDWTDTEQDNYKIKDKLGEDVERYDSVYQRFRIARGTGWDLYVGHPSKFGPREILSQCLTEDSIVSESEAHRKIKLRLWRWDATSNTYREAPETVNVTINPDLTITIRGYDADDDPFQDAGGKRKYPRYLCKIPDEESAWEVHSFRITASFEDDTRLTGYDEDEPTGWPQMTEAVDGVDAYKESRISAIHGTLDDVPVQNDYDEINYMDPYTESELHSDQHVVDVHADRLLDQKARPSSGGTLTLPGHNWVVHPGMLISELTGGGDPPITTVVVWSHIKSVTLVGLAAEAEGQSRTQIELGEN